MRDILEQIHNVGIIPVIKIEDKDIAVDLAKALSDGGLNTIEVTVRNDTALESIHLIKEALPTFFVGAGTITNPELAQEAIAAGADYIVAPGLHIPTVEYCKRADVPIVPGCVTPSEIQQAMDLGLTTLKFFPAARFGGLAGIKDLAGPFASVKFIPTGGITMDMLGEYLSCNAIAAVGGSFMAKPDLIARHDWETITQQCRRCVELSLGFELAHVGVNCTDQDAAVEVAQAMDARFPLGVKVGGKSTFLGSAVEFMHTMYYGQNGHIGFRTNSPERAKAFFESRGLAVREDSIARDAKGNIKFFYLKDEVAGFALHVVKK